MAVWSVRKLFRNVSARDFQEAVTSLQESVAKNSVPAPQLRIAFFRRAKNDLSYVGVEAGALVEKMNPVRPFQIVSNPSDITPALWWAADYVQALLQSADGSRIIARAEAKGLAPKQITFSASPDDPGEAVKKDSLACFSGWTKGDGVDSNWIRYGI